MTDADREEGYRYRLSLWHSEVDLVCARHGLKRAQLLRMLNDFGAFKDLFDWEERHRFLSEPADFVPRALGGGVSDGFSESNLG